MVENRDISRREKIEYEKYKMMSILNESYWFDLAANSALYKLF